ncbi:MAG: hypothetical protein H6608_00990 [Flavobacteriales bacterium]|nr:hypothetical protein [Bacteroidota bacterium]MCB9239682.1 hypothetical protein [Flavobacteriales bacterium]
MKNLLLKTLVVLGILQLSCREVEEPVISANYYPLAIGTTWIYQVDSTVYDDFLGDSTHFTMLRKEEVVSSFVAGKDSVPTYLISIYTASSDSSPWIYQKSCSGYQTDHVAVRTNQNIPEVKMVFPVVNRKSWDGNQLNTQGKDTYRFINIGLIHQIEETIFHNTVRVEQENTQSADSEDIRWEIYAPEVGLIEKKVSKTELIDGNKGGVHYSWKLKSFTSH